MRTIYTILFLMLSSFVSAQTTTSVISGSFTSNSTWSTNSVPTSGNIRIKHTVNIPANTNLVIDTIFVDTGGTFQRTSGSGQDSVKITGVVVLNGGTFGTNSGSGAIVIEGDVFVLSNVASLPGIRTLITGNVYCNGNSLTIPSRVRIEGNLVITKGTVNNDGTVLGLTITNGVVPSDLSIKSNYDATGNLKVPNGVTVNSNGFRFTRIDTVFLDGNLVLSNSNGLLHSNGAAFKSNAVIIQSSKSKIHYNGNNQNITPIAYNNLQISGNGTKTITDTTRVLRKLELSNSTLNTNSKLVIRSTKDYTANVGQIASGSIVGDVIVERYFDSIGRAWRFVSTSVKTRLADWKGEVFITGPGGAANGFDPTPSNNSSFLFYNEALPNSGWTAFQHINDSLIPGRGYMIFIRGDRSDTNRLTRPLPQNQVVVNGKGPLNQGNISVNLSYTNNSVPNDDGWNLIGNPYASAYNMNAFFDNEVTTNMQKTIWIYSPVKRGYVAYNTVSNLGDLTGGIVPSGSAFFVKATAPTSITFKEQYKVDTIPITLFKSQPYTNLVLRMSPINSSIYDDYQLAYFNDSIVSDSVDEYDIVKMNGDINLRESNLSLSVRKVKTHFNDSVWLDYTLTGQTLRFSLIENSINDQIFLVNAGKFYNLKDSVARIPVQEQTGRTLLLIMNNILLSWKPDTKQKPVKVNTNESGDFRITFSNNTLKINSEIQSIKQVQFFNHVGQYLKIVSLPNSTYEWSTTVDSKNTQIVLIMVVLEDGTVKWTRFLPN